MIFTLRVTLSPFVFGAVLYISLTSLLSSNAVANVFKKADFPAPVSPIIKMLMYGISWDIGYDNSLKNARQSAKTYSNN